VQAQVGPELDILKLYHQSWHPEQKEHKPTVMKRNAVKHTAEEEEKMKNKEEEERRKDKKKKKEEVEEAKMMMILQNKREICSLQPQTTLKYGTSDTFVLNTAFLAF
jgi:hypothetical protein